MASPRKLAILLLVLLVSSVSAQEAAKKRESEPKLKLETIELDRTSVTLPCPPGRTPLSGSCNDSATIIAKVVASEGMPQNTELHITVSGGRITARDGREFQWDLGGVYAGTYTFTVAATDGNGKWGESVTREVRIAECSCGYVDACPTLKMDEVKSVPAGELMEFTVKVSGDPGDSVTYNWTVSVGTIESGQGTKTIKVRTDESMEGYSVTATVEIGNLPSGPACQTSATETGGVLAKKPKED